ncbi:predicted protein [Histoplasma capsulatum H143]|uniref:Uncharacterized protein n=1 Tax=Ajellomyces capsulatus (strain H143) TaxID=544712 RepID=C6H405_AJECH|nr:predicted protein [Histoplasma capsulatum H143]
MGGSSWCRSRLIGGRRDEKRMEVRFEAYLANTDKVYDRILPSNGRMSNKGSGPEDSSTKGYHRIAPMVETTKRRKCGLIDSERLSKYRAKWFLRDPRLPAERPCLGGLPGISCNSKHKRAQHDERRRCYECSLANEGCEGLVVRTPGASSVPNDKNGRGCVAADCTALWLGSRLKGSQVPERGRCTSQTFQGWTPAYLWSCYHGIIQTGLLQTIS